MGSAEWRRRDRRLLELAARWYVKHYVGGRNIMKLLGLSEDERYGVASALLAEFVNAMTVVVKAALRDLLVYREFAVVYGDEIFGALDVGRTVAVLPAGVYASLTYLPSLQAPEYGILRRMALKVSKWGREAAVDEEMRKDAERLRRIAKRLPKAYGRAAVDVREGPPWLRQGWAIYRAAKALVEGEVYVGERRGVGKALKFVNWRLYEMYIAMLVLEALRRLGWRTVGVDAEKRAVLVERDGKTLAVYLNRALPHHSIIEEVAGDEVRGRPDLTVANADVKAVVECKYSDRPGYIARGRFQVMTYMCEYSAKIGILVYPAASEEEAEDEEEEAAVRWANSGKPIRMKDGRAIYPLRIDPAYGATADEAREKHIGEVMRLLERSL
ncbi:hypothetical protein [Pyrobaculum neutrophilum]|uniref:5-methylcytosine restriction system component-like protein n=1 Tax=Pyrobaculum neutrophilum (strain DSM 2338 / JCM 9278 / NBRC 100436 / V24Sta) TaxID=444157 RepID=B1YDS1_PYRNV|nr:hypothetical protein [Pyrobaculum neutrophilum]ACB39934.1 conserved hypothetical protein [Pyrobaculum neutrophilum V24Sta]